MTSILKNVCIDKLDDIVNKYKNTSHSSIKMKLADLKSSTYIEFYEKTIRKVLDLKLAIMLEYQNIKGFLQKVMLQIGLKKLFVIKKIKSTVPWTYVISDLTGEEIVGKFYEKELEKTNQKEFTVEKVIKRKGVELYVKWKV